MRVIECGEQGSGSWLNARVGKVTASEIHHVIAMLKKGGESQARKDYKARIVAETLTGSSANTYVSPAMQWGTEYEGYARAAYEVSQGVEVDKVGFVLHPKWDRSGASPDGLVGEDGLIEIKCPSTTTHIDYLLADEVPDDYKAQMSWQMLCTERLWCDFVSFDPRLPDPLQLFVKRYPRDEGFICVLEEATEKFLAEVDDILARLPKPVPHSIGV